MTGFGLKDDARVLKKQDAVLIWLFEGYLMK